jgi:hypothetical protein
VTCCVTECSKVAVLLLQYYSNDVVVVRTVRTTTFAQNSSPGHGDCLLVVVLQKQRVLRMSIWTDQLTEVAAVAMDDLRDRLVFPLITNVPRYSLSSESHQD